MALTRIPSRMLNITNADIRVFTSSTTYTPTAGMKFCQVECVGGGGGGGGAGACYNSVTTFAGGVGFAGVVIITEYF